MCAMPAEARRGHQIPQSWSYWPRVLGTKLGPSAIAVFLISELSTLAPLVAPKTYFFFLDVLTLDYNFVHSIFPHEGVLPYRTDWPQISGPRLSSCPAS